MYRPRIAHELPNVFHRIEFGRAWRKRQDGDVGGDVEFRAGMPRGLINDEDSVSVRRYGLRDLVEMPVHGVEVAPGQDEGRSLALFRTYRSEDPGRTCALIGRRAWTGAASGPAARQLRFLADPRLVAPPEFDGLAGMPGPDPGYDVGEAFLKTSWASGSWAWCRGRPVRRRKSRPRITALSRLRERETPNSS